MAISLRNKHKFLFILLTFLLSSISYAEDNNFKFTIEEFGEGFCIKETNSLSFELIQSFDTSTPKITKIEKKEYYNLVYINIGSAGTSNIITQYNVAIFDNVKKEFIKIYPYQYESSKKDFEINQPILKIEGKKIIFED